MRDLLERLAPEVDVDAAWEEVRSRLDRHHRGRVLKVVAVAAAVVLVASGAVLAARAGDGDDSAPATVPTTVDEPGTVTVETGVWRLRHPDTWTVGTRAAADREVLVVGTGEVPPWCPDDRLCGQPVCPAWPSPALEALPADGVLVWFELFPAPGMELTGRSQLDAVPRQGPARPECVVGDAEVTETFFPGPDRQAIAVYFAVGGEAPRSLRREAIAIASSISAS